MLIRVLEIPAPTGRYHFGGGEPQTFIEVDWFRDAAEIADVMGGDPADVPTIRTERGRALLADYIRGKRYFNPAKAYLVLAQEHSFTIGYSAP